MNVKDLEYRTLVRLAKNNEIHAEVSYYTSNRKESVATFEYVQDLNLEYFKSILQVELEPHELSSSLQVAISIKNIKDLKHHIYMNLIGGLTFGKVDIDENELMKDAINQIYNVVFEECKNCIKF